MIQYKHKVCFQCGKTNEQIDDCQSCQPNPVVARNCDLPKRIDEKDEYRKFGIKEYYKEVHGITNMHQIMMMTNSTYGASVEDAYKQLEKITNNFADWRAKKIEEHKQSIITSWNKQHLPQS